jgi:hypothetical protein
MPSPQEFLAEGHIQKPIQIEAPSIGSVQTECGRSVMGTGPAGINSSQRIRHLVFHGHKILRRPFGEQANPDVFVYESLFHARERMKRKMVFINLIYKNIIHLQPAWHKEPRVNDKERSNTSLIQECNIKPFTITNHTNVLHIVLALQVLWGCLLHDEELLLFPKMFFPEELSLPL